LRYAQRGGGYAPPASERLLHAAVRRASAPAATSEIPMTAFPSERRRSKLPLLVILLLIVVGAVAGGAWYFGPRFESEAPQIAVSPNVDIVGVAPLEIQVADKGTGLKTVTATLTQGGTEHKLAAEQFDKPQGEKKITVALAKVAGVKEGPAVLKVTARDASLFSGNETVVQKNITIDITPPTLELIADDRYVNFGGVGAIVYKASADTATSGVKIGEHFFPGFAGHVKDHADHFVALFAHPYDTAPDARPTIIATDKAGNTREMKLAYELKNVKYKKSTIAVSDAFLQNKVAPLLTDATVRQGAAKDIFVAVNKRLRKENEDRITEITKKATSSLQWKDAFTQLPNSKVEANFADQRTYTYNGEAIDTALHLGYDLSVTKNVPVEASNGGTVVFAGDLGIYGNTVILDHGLGLFTLYSHLSSIDVKEGTAVTKRQIIGKSGETGLAAGDHLHFGVYLAGVAILPVEWWDQKWIEDNIKPKLEGHSGQEIAEAQQAAKPKKHGGKKRRA
jgi:murein DD-endopeptidase MepM/ murein hydrolase activator NlpD